MLDTSDILDLNKPHITGRIITAPRGCTFPELISVPSSSNILVLSAEDMGKNSIAIDNMDIPVFSGDNVQYAGQPIIAVFGNDTDSTEQICKQIKIEYSDVDYQQRKVDVLKQIPINGEYRNRKVKITKPLQAPLSRRDTPYH